MLYKTDRPYTDSDEEPPPPYPGRCSEKQAQASPSEKTPSIANKDQVSSLEPCRTLWKKFASFFSATGPVAPRNKYRSSPAHIYQVTSTHFPPKHQAAGDAKLETPLWQAVGRLH